MRRRKGRIFLVSHLDCVREFGVDLLAGVQLFARGRENLRPASVNRNPFGHRLAGFITRHRLALGLNLNVFPTSHTGTILFDHSNDLTEEGILLDAASCIDSPASYQCLASSVIAAFTSSGTFEALP